MRKRHRNGEAVVGQRARVAGIHAAPPQVVEVDAADRMPERAERVDVGEARLAPIAELDAELERGLRLGDQLALVEADRAIERAQLRQRCLADADDADLVAFDQADVGRRLAEQADEPGGGHPAGGPAADDHDPKRAFLAHPSLPVFGACKCR